MVLGALVVLLWRGDLVPRKVLEEEREKRLKVQRQRDDLLALSACWDEVQPPALPVIKTQTQTQTQTQTPDVVRCDDAMGEWRRRLDGGCTDVKRHPVGCECD